MKRPASKGCKQGGFEITSLKYPGTGESAPKYYKKSTIYTSTLKKQWRVKAKPGDKLDRSFSFAGEGKDPKEVWKEVAGHLNKLNP